MFKRLKTSLFVPREIINMRVDRFGVVFLYLLILSFILMIPACIKVARFKSISFDRRLQIQEAFNGEEVPFEIINYHLAKDTELTNKDFVITRDLMVSFCKGSNLEDPTSKITYRVVFLDQSVDLYYYFRGIKVANIMLFKYSDYTELENIDLRLATSSENYDFWNKMIGVVNKEIQKYIPYAAFTVVISYTFVNLGMMLLIALVLTLFQRISIRRIISFKESYVIACYACSPLIVSGLLSELFNLRFIYTIGIAIAAVYNMIAAMQLISINDRR